MAKAIETLSIQLKFKDAGSQAVIEKLRGSLKRLEMGAAGARPNIKGLRNEILSQGRASVKSVANINAQVTALRALRDEAKIGGNTFKMLTKDIDSLNKSIGKSPGSGGGRNMGARRATQTAGAIISGGIFGGPEGAIGGALGAFGGVEGAFAGAAIGAQVGMLRQTIAQTAEYAASIEKLKIALGGVLPNQDDFNFAVQAAESATKELNIPQEQSIRGVTRLSAAVTGAGGPVRDATAVFRNVTAAIKATGGSSEDVQGAITAMVQVFSKGKVSAEELSGQLGERLPGAVTMFAKANDMTLPELQKNLKAGTVGLNELMSFIHELGTTYEGTARQISDSNADAGARLSVAISEMQASIGASLIPIGAQFQNAFTGFIQQITPFLVANVPRLASFFLNLAKNLDTLAVAAVAAFSVFAIAKIAAIISSLGGIALALGAIQQKLIAVALANPFIALAAGAGLLAGAIFNASKEQRRFNQLLREGSVAEVNAALLKAEKERDTAAGKLVTAKQKAGDYSNSMLLSGFEAEQLAFNNAQTRVEQLRKRKTQITDLNPTQGAALERYSFSQFEPFDYGNPTVDGGGTGGGTGKNELARRIEQAQRLEAQTVKQLRLSEAQNSIQRLNAKHANERVALEAKLTDMVGDGTNEEINKTAERIRANTELRIENELRKEGQKMGKMLADAAEKEANEKKKLNDQLQQSLADRKLELGLITQEEFNQLEIARERQRLEEMQASNPGRITDEQIEEQMNLFQKVLNQTPLDKFIKSGKDSLKDLHTVAVNISQGIGNAVGNALTSGVMGLIEGTKTAKEVFADFLKSVGQILAQEGAKMIATYIAIGIAKAFAGLLGGGSKAPTPIPGAAPQMTQNAIVTPTGFTGQFAGMAANGGPVEAGRPYVVGERGPEMFIPGSNGGIMRNEDMRRMMGNSPAGAGAPQMNFTFETTNIGGTEFVSREQLEQAMVTTRRQATKDGAKRGMSMTLDKMQNSPRTRSRVGIS
mgnify:CR=1 FL=1